MKRKHLYVFVITIFSILLAACSPEPKVMDNFVPAANEDSFRNPDWIEKKPESLSQITDPTGKYYYAYSQAGQCYYFMGPTDRNITEIVVENTYNGLPVKRIHDDAFRDMTALKSVTIPEGIESIGSGAFQGCSALESVTLPQSIKRIEGYAFSGTAITTLDIPDGVEYMGDGVFSYSALTTFTIPACLDGIPEAMFQGCESLTELILHENVTRIGARAFRYSSYKFTAYDQITYYGDYAFANCANFPDKVVFPQDTTYIGRSLYIYSGVKEVVFSEGITEIPDECFYDCFSLTSVEVPDSVKRIGGFAFYRCTALSKSIHIPSSIEEIGSCAFYQYPMKDTIILPNTIKTLGSGAFRESKIYRIEIPESVSTIPYSFCRDCPELNIVTTRASRIESHAFVDCSKLRTLEISNLAEIGEYAFAFTAIEDLSIHGTLTAIGEYAFYGCGKLETLNMPNSVREIKDGAFGNCDALRQVRFFANKNFPTLTGGGQWGGRYGINGLTSNLETIGNRAFEGCINLLHIQLPPTVRWVGSKAFRQYVGGYAASVVVTSPDIEFVYNAFHDIGEARTVKIYGTTYEIRDALKNTQYGDRVQNELSPWGDGS